MSEKNAPSQQQNEELTPELILAIERARQRMPSAESVARLTDIMSRRVISDRMKSKWQIWPGWQWMAAVAASIAIVSTISVWWPLVQKPNGKVERHDPQLDPSDSAITRVLLVQVGFQRIQQDLDLADARVEELTESMAIAGVRREILETLEFYYDWSK